MFSKAYFLNAIQLLTPKQIVQTSCVSLTAILLALPSVANATGAHFRAKKIYSKFKTMFRNLGASNPQPSTVLRDALTATPALFMFRSVF